MGRGSSAQRPRELKSIKWLKAPHARTRARASLVQLEADQLTTEPQFVSTKSKHTHTYSRYRGASN